MSQNISSPKRPSPIYSDTAMVSSSPKPQWSPIRGTASHPSTFNRDHLNMFIAFIFAVQLSPYGNVFPALPRFFFFDSARDLISFEFSSAGLVKMSLATISSSFCMTLDIVQKMSNLFLDAGFLEHVQDHFDDEAAYRFTLLGLNILDRFLHENSDLQNFLKASLGVTSTQTTAVPLPLVTLIGGQYFMQASLIEDAQDILSTTFNDGGVYQFTPKYFASAVTFPSGPRVLEEDDDSVITRPNETQAHKLRQHKEYHHLLDSRSQSHLAAPSSSAL